jgi:hypothetical protein
MKLRAGLVLLSWLAIAVLVWVMAFHNGWAAAITEPLFVPGSLLVLTLTPVSARAPEISVIFLGYAVDFVLTWALTASVVGFILRLISKGKISA